MDSADVFITEYCNDRMPPNPPKTATTWVVLLIRVPKQGRILENYPYDHRAKEPMHPWHRTWATCSTSVCGLEFRQPKP